MRARFLVENPYHENPCILYYNTRVWDRQYVGHWDVPRMRRVVR